MLDSMRSARFIAVHATTLAGAFEELKVPADVALLDLNLPDSRDLDTLRRLRTHSPDLPILIVTGMEDRQKAVQALSEGAQDYLVKGQVDGYLLERAICRQLGIPARERT